MILLVFLSCVFWCVVSAAPGLDLSALSLGGLDLGHAPILSHDLLSAPIYSSAPILKALPAPLLEHAPIISHAPLLAPAPIIKTIAAAPVIKAIAPAATSYASVTQYHIAHAAPIVKTIVAAPPILKSYIPTPIALSHGYH